MAASFLQVQSGHKELGNRILFSNLTLAINEGEHVGVIGPNGAGKTTLFRILAEEMSLDHGSLVKARHLRLGYLKQQSQRDPHQRVLDILVETFGKELWQWQKTAPRFGLTPRHLGSKWGSLSGGYRMRVELLALEGQEPNLLLLDEPTNYLDLESVLFLESYLADYSGAFLLISHDREFLRKTTDHILEIESGEATKFNGNLDDYFEQKEWLRANLEAQKRAQDEKRAAVLEFVARFGAKATKARQAQSRLKQLDRMEPISIKRLPSASTFRVHSPERQPRELIRLESATLGYGQKCVVDSVDWILGRGEHWGVVGYNGAGKSTFLKTVAGEIPLISGKRGINEALKIGYFSQHVAEALDPSSTILESLASKAHVSLDRQDLLNMAGALLFSGDDVHKRISVLSGGEKTRVALGQVLLSRANLLILDEPTNHLDFASVEALTQALMTFEGAFVVVSHDRSFIQRVGTQILEISEGRLRSYPGTYEEYVWSVARGVYAEIQAEDAPAPNAAPSSARDQKPAPSKKDRLKQLQSLERAIVKVEKQLALVDLELEALMSKALFGEWSELNQKKSVLESQWESLMQERDRLNSP